MLERLLFPMENSVEIVELLLVGLKVKVTTTTLTADLKEHPEFPSLLSISDVLTSYHINNVAFKAEASDIEKFSLPFLVQLNDEKNGTPYFSVVQSVNIDTVQYYNPQKHSWEIITKEAFTAKWVSGILLLAEVAIREGITPGEKAYVKKRHREKALIMTKYSAFLLLPLLTMIASLHSFFQKGILAFSPILFTAVTMIGGLISFLLVWYEQDQYNPVLKQICSKSSKKVNCSAILQSKAGKIWGISWSVIGAIYFFGGLLALLFSGIQNQEIFFLLSWINAFSIPYVFFSIYYQWRIAKQWCALCLLIQCVLTMQLIIGLFNGWHNLDLIELDGTFFVPFILSYSMPFLVLHLLLPAYRIAKEAKVNKIKLQQLKLNPQVFNALLNKQKKVIDNTNQLGITLGKPDATFKIIKVCNPYCKPCARVHPQIEELLNLGLDLQVQIIFAITDMEDDIKHLPAKHLLAIAENDNDTITSEALDFWYSKGDMDYQKFAEKYRLNMGLKDQNSKISAMREWCNSMDIRFTPTFFFNGNQLPEMYNIHDLKYFLLQSTS